MEATTKILETLTNTELGVEVVLAKIADRFSVVLRDTDVNETVSGRIFTTIEPANAYMASLFGSL